ncbi:MAG: YgfZ/GcvT domain-containing protein [Legionella sp.]
MNTAFEHLINDRALTACQAIESELKLQPGKNYLFKLSYLNALDVEGDKSVDFLHGQLTCDVHSMSDIQMIQGAQCNLKGRILTLIDVVTWHGVKLILPQDLTEATVNSLNKTAMLSHVSLKTNTNLLVFGLYLQNQEDIAPETRFFPNALHAQTYSEHSCYYHLGNGFYIFLVQSEVAEEMQKHFMEKEQLLGSLTWHTLRLAQKQIDIYPNSRGLFLPHRLDLHQTQYLNFNKGCYKGQEIIARMHYKATLKHQMKIYEIQTAHKIHSGQKLLNKTDGAEVGELVDYSMLNNDGRYLIAVSMLKGADLAVLFEGHTDPISLQERS